MINGLNLTSLQRLLLPFALALLVSCGGGVDSGGTGSPPPSTLAIGTVTGFGSVIVGGVRYDDSDASVRDDSGAVLQPSDTRLGMQAEIVASQITTSNGVASATASSILIRSEIVGPVQAIDLGASTATVLGQNVSTGPATVFDVGATTGLAALAVGDVVKVYATLDVAGRRYVATRLERDAGGGDFKLRGAIRSLSLSNRTVAIGAATVDWSGVAPDDPAAALAVGRIVRFTLARSTKAGVWTATSLQAGQAPQPDRERAEVEGRVTAFTSTTRFDVDGLPVDASGAAFPDGTAGLALGRQVELKGSLVGGTLVASEVKIDDEDGGSEPIELEGTISAVDVPAQRFIVRGVTVVWNADTDFDSNTSPSDIQVGREVEVRGLLSEGGTSIVANRIRVEN